MKRKEKEMKEKKKKQKTEHEEELIYQESNCSYLCELWIYIQRQKLRKPPN